MGVKDNLKTFESIAKLLNTDPEILIEFFLDFGVVLLADKHMPLLKRLNDRLTETINKHEQIKNPGKPHEPKEN